MKITTNESLNEFRWWGGAISRAQMLSYDELNEFEAVMEELYPDGVDETTLNDIMWFDFEWVCESIGLEYNIEEDKIYR